MGDSERLTAKQFQETDGVEDWRVLAFGVSAWFDAPSHASGAGLVRRVAELGAADVDLRARGVHVRLPTQDAGITVAEVELARAISAAARDLGLGADPSAVQNVLLTIDALDKGAVMPFWQAALGYVQLGDDDLVDPMRRDPGIWFQQQDEPRPLPNRIHVDISRTQEPAVEAAGGRHVGGHFDVLHVDAEGNEADLCRASGFGDGPETEDWHLLFGGMTFYPTESPVRSAELAAAVGRLADEAGLPLLIDLRPDGVTIDTGKDQWEDSRFGELAVRVQAAARGLGLTADRSRLRFVQFGIAAVDVPAVRRFWRDVLGYEYDPRSEHGVTDIYDPRRLNPPIFFQQMPASAEGEEVARRAQRNRIHIDIFVPDDQARARIDAALAAGGRVVYDADAPAGVTIADPEGNEVDIAVSVGREEAWEAAQAGTR